MVDACLHTGTHYLDLTGEIPVYEAIASRDAEAKARGVMLLPGTGFDVVPTDCLALHLKQRLPSATRLSLAFHGEGPAGLPPGTQKTAIELAPYGDRVRRNGRLEIPEAGGKTRAGRFWQGPSAGCTPDLGRCLHGLFQHRHSQHRSLYGLCPNRSANKWLRLALVTSLIKTGRHPEFIKARGKARSNRGGTRPHLCPCLGRGGRRTGAQGRVKAAWAGSRGHLDHASCPGGGQESPIRQCSPGVSDTRQGLWR